MRVVLDSNILLVALGKRSRYRPIWTDFLSEAYELVISEEVLHEYEEILQLYSAPGVSDLVMEVFVEATNILYQKVYYQWEAIKSDPDDNKFFDIAVAGNADYIVTNDAHFNVLKQLAFPSVKIISGEEFLSILQSNSEL
ncbi:putative toxin-antitoxin system toxin component, PIN family [Mucilaginibacter pedocola]|uniref:Putative toxin-antitoxin system toxin component, PIN family n=1 Tax=Mucilaginibacter pedocola TaxID=1792845 RepID=A0A1S9PFG2_9SPHI|nr:putative toxin-antitoxin system toxin component, PIN family [Mucilaginibacter pedocola]OOQ59704.1 putative toxin-antitoxin system toxin component, PIN family [Mucilaginibacter pedocola]